MKYLKQKIYSLNYYRNTYINYCICLNEVVF